MSLNKDAYTRYRVINRVLVVRKKATLKEMQQACADVLGKSISARTIKRDIEDMRFDTRLDWQAPILFDRRESKYYYDRQGFSIDRLPINEEEVGALMFASSILEQFRDVEILRSVEGAVQKIADHLRIRKAMRNSGLAGLIDFEKVPATGGSEFLAPLITAIMENRAVRLTHQGFDRPSAHTHTFHPYMLKEYRNRWYVLGYNGYHQELRTHALDRIKKVEEDPHTLFRPPEFPPQEYFREVIGITRYEETIPWHVVLKFSSRQAPYILTQPLHESQKIIEKTRDYTIISLDVHPSPELGILLLGWHSEVEVVKPAELREQIRQMHLKAAGI